MLVIKVIDSWFPVQRLTEKSRLKTFWGYRTQQLCWFNYFLVLIMKRKPKYGWGVIYLLDFVLILFLRAILGAKALQRLRGPENLIYLFTGTNFEWFPRRRFARCPTNGDRLVRPGGRHGPSPPRNGPPFPRTVNPPRSYLTDLRQTLVAPVVVVVVVHR